MQHTFTLTNPNFKDECAKQHCFMLSLYLWSHLDALNWNIKSNLEIRVTWDCPKKTWSSVIFLHFDVFYHIPPGIEYVRFSPQMCWIFLLWKKKREFDLLIKTVLSAQRHNHMLWAPQYCKKWSFIYRVQSRFAHRCFLIILEFCVFAKKQESL